MKYFFLGLFFLFSFFNTKAQGENQLETIIITAKKGKTQVHVDGNGILQVNVSPKDITKFKKKGFVSYYDFGAAGNGKTDDIDAIAATHAYANKNNLNVKADSGANYYIGGKNRSAIIQTNTDFGKAKFTIDDRKVENIKTPVFIVSSNSKPFNIQKISSLKKDQEKIEINLPVPAIITATNTSIKHYIRMGLNKNNGASQTDIFLVDKNGNIDMNSPIIWDFNDITHIEALPVNEQIVNITGGYFTTIANRAESKYTYYNRNISVRRSNVVIDGLKHDIIGEGDHGAPYHGFISIKDCAYITVKNTTLTGHKTYKTIGNAGKPVSMGSYDISVNRALNVSFINCNQTNDIHDKKYWGLIASNYSKNLLFDQCTFSRFDAHKGVANATIKNSTIGHMGIRAIGSGTLRVENTSVSGENFISLRQDYGSTWQGKIIIKNCVFLPITKNKVSNIELIGGAYSGQHNFGYICYMPKEIIIDNLLIDDSKYPKDYKGPFVFKDFNPKFNNNSYQETFPYVITKKVFLKNVTTSSGRKLTISDNKYMFKDIVLDVSN